MFQIGSFQGTELLDNSEMILSQAAEAEFASMGEVWGEEGDGLESWAA
jgi:hypothetical protein